MWGGLTHGCHHITPDIVWQDFRPDHARKFRWIETAGYTVPAEIQLPHEEGAIAMARKADAVNPTRASSGSQFYITLAPTHFLDEGYTAFGQVKEGMDVVQSIAIGDVIESITIAEE